MASGVFSLRTLNDNWFEDRLQPAGSLNVTGSLHERQPRKYETDIANIGERYDVLSRISRLPPRTSYATPHDGFDEKHSTHIVDFAHPKSRKDFVSKPPDKPSTITSESVPEVSYENRRPVPGTQSGFGAVLNRHDKTHGQRHWNTTHGDFFGAGSRVPDRRIDAAEKHPSGVTSASEEVRCQGLKVGVLSGECFRESSDPAADTRTQRAWMYNSDPALRNIAYGGSRPSLPPEDNALSVQLGDGAMSKVRADLAERKGKLFRVATTITKGLGQRPGMNKWQDHP